jgi:hypothetical protein
MGCLLTDMQRFARFITLARPKQLETKFHKIITPCPPEKTPSTLSASLFLILASQALTLDNARDRSPLSTSCLVMIGDGFTMYIIAFRSFAGRRDIRAGEEKLEYAPLRGRPTKVQTPLNDSPAGVAQDILTRPALRELFSTRSPAKYSNTSKSLRARQRGDFFTTLSSNSFSLRHGERGLGNVGVPASIVGKSQIVMCLGADWISCS